MGDSVRASRKSGMNLPFPKRTQGYIPFAGQRLLFFQALVFASWAFRIPDIKSSWERNDADPDSVLFAVPVIAAP